jgi:hypothetical protein
MNSPLITDSSLGSESFKVLSLNNALYTHSLEGLNAHDSEGVVAYTFTDSGGNSLSVYSLLIGGQNESGTVQKVYLPIKSFVPVPTVSGLFKYSFVGLGSVPTAESTSSTNLGFQSQDDFDLALVNLTLEINSDASTSADEKTAMTNLLSTLQYGSADQDYDQVVNGVTYTIHLTIYTSQAYILVSYQR